MNKKIKKTFIIMLFIVATLGCIALGFKSRYDVAINLTQFVPQTEKSSMGYMLKTNQDKIVMIDGGTEGDTEHIKQAIKENGGIVEVWYLTNTREEHYGVLMNILNDANSEIIINNIFLNFNTEEWYQINDSKEFNNIKRLLDVLAKLGVKEKVHILQNREETVVDNLNFKILKIVEPEEKENSGNNQSVIIKVSNMFKSVLFLSDLNTNLESDFVNHNLDEIECDVVQISNHGNSGVSKFTYEKIKPKVCLWPVSENMWNTEKNIEETRKILEELNIEENYIAKDGDITIKIW